jgi:serine/threonine protein kinase
MTSNIGTLQYSAPEIIMGEDYDEKVDVYSFAMIMYELFYEQLAFVDTMGESMWRLGERVVKQRLRPTVPDPKSPDYDMLNDSQKLYIDVMVQAWSHEAKLRPSFSALYSLIDSIGRLDN